MSPKSDVPHCLLIQKYALNILKYTEAMTEKQFCNSSITYDACILNFITIGEQAKSLSVKFQEKHPQIAFRKIIGLRNIAAHSYEGLEPFRLYMSICNDVPILYEQISKIIKLNDFD